MGWGLGGGREGAKARSRELSFFDVDNRSLGRESHKSRQNEGKHQSENSEGTSESPEIKSWDRDENSEKKEEEEKTS